MRQFIAALCAIAFLCVAAFSGCAPADRENSTEQNGSIGDITAPTDDITPGTETYRGFTLDSVYHSDEGEIYYNVYFPESYDGTAAYALFMTLPGYEGLYRFGAGANLRSEEFAFEAQNYIEDMIILAPQLNDWGMTSARQAVALLDYFLAHYNVDPARIYAEGFSGGGETLSLVMQLAPERFSAVLHVNSVWDGELAPLIQSRTPVYLVIGESDEYYGSARISATYEEIVSLYEAEGLSEEEIDELVVLDIKDAAYFEAVGAQNQHSGGGYYAFDEEIMGWLFSHSRGYTRNTAISDVIHDPVFGDCGRLLFPVDDWYYSGDTLGNLSMTWYSHIDPDKTVEICNYLHSRAAAGERIFYDIYTDEEKAADPSLEDTGLFFFKGDEGAPFAVTCAGGGWAYVAAMHDSFPHALELSKRGYNAFAIIYRPGVPTAYRDLARALTFIFENAEILGVSTEGYSLWGGSAGARMAAELGSFGAVAYYGGEDLPMPAAVIMQYTGYSGCDPNGEPPTFACVGDRDGIANWRTMERRTEALSAMGVPTEFHVYEGLGHGFGLGTGTVSEGWFSLAVQFWENNR